MTSESELRDLLKHEAERAQPLVDVESVVRRAKARRAPRHVAFGAAVAAAACGVVLVAVVSVPSLFPSSTGSSHSAADSGAESLVDGSLPEGASSGLDSHEPRPSTSTSLTGECGTSMRVESVNSGGLQLSVEFPSSAPATGHTIEGTVTLTNSGSALTEGTTTSPPAITARRNGVTVWHSSGDLGGRRFISLAPGDSVTFPAWFTTVACTAEDENGGRLRDDLPRLEAGSVDLSAAILFVPQGSEVAPELIVSGTHDTILLR